MHPFTTLRLAFTTLKCLTVNAADIPNLAGEESLPWQQASVPLESVLMFG